MKALFALALLLGCATSFATSLEHPPRDARASAFTDAGKLYITYLGDTCNGYRVSLNVSGLCLDDRLTRNYATTCNATVSMASTRMGCPEGVKARVATFDLKEEKVAREAQVLNLVIDGGEISVKVNR